jgi:ribosome-associated protein
MKKITILTADAPNEGELEWDGPSKSQRKRESTALQDLGEELVGLSKERLAKIDMPERLLEAILEAQRITAHGGRKRQLQFIGKLMRSADVDPLQAAVDEVKGQSAATTARQHRLEALRTKLMADEAAFQQLAEDYPAADIQRLRQLRRNALKEAEQKKPPKSFRELFRELRDLADSETPDAHKPAPSGDDEANA